MFDFCIVEIHKRKIMHLRIFQAKCASSLFDTKKKNSRGWPCAEFTWTQLISKLVNVQSTPMSDIRLDRIDHMPNRNEKRERTFSLTAYHGQ